MKSAQIHPLKNAKSHKITFHRANRGVLTSQCLNRRIPDKQALIEEIAGQSGRFDRVRMLRYQLVGSAVAGPKGACGMSLTCLSDYGNN